MKQLIVTILLFLSIGSVAFATDCPRGLVDDPYPGECGLYVDKNNNGICDYSEEVALPDNQEINTGINIDEETLMKMTVGELAATSGKNLLSLENKLSKYSGIDVTASTKLEYLHDQYEVCMNYVKGILNEIEDSVDNKPTTTRHYYSLEISIIFFLLYIASLVLVRRGILSTVLNRKLWNLLLLISFIVVTITSIAMILRMDYSIALFTGFDYAYWHIESGIVMIIVSIFHTLWHYNYYSRLFSRK